MSTPFDTAHRSDDLANNGIPREPATPPLDAATPHPPCLTKRLPARSSLPTANSSGLRPAFRPPSALHLSATTASWCLLFLISLLLLANALNRDYNHDEETYVFSAVLAGDLSLYSDFMYLQTPIYPLLQSLVFAAFDEKYFMVARLTSWFFAIGSTLLLFRLSQEMTGSVAAAAAFAAMFAFSTLILAASGSARNDIMPVFFLLFGIWWYSYARQTATNFTPIAYFLSGVCFALAVGVKVLYVFVPAVVVMWQIIHWAVRRDDRQAFHVVALILGGVVGSMPLVYFPIVAWDQFLFGVYTYHVTWLDLTPGQAPIGSRLFTALTVLNSDIVVTASVLVVGLLINIGGYGIRTVVKNEWVVLFGILLIVGVLFCLLPKPSHPQYFIPLVPLLLLLAAALYGMVPKGEMNAARVLLAAVAITGAAPGFVLALDESFDAMVGRPLAHRMHQVSDRIRETLRGAGLEGRLATLSPIRAIDSGLQVYKEFSTGPFFFRMADGLDEGEIYKLHGVSPATLENLFEHDGPVAILTGVETTWDRPLVEYAERMGYSKAEGDFDGLTLFLQSGAKATLTSGQATKLWQQ